MSVTPAKHALLMSITPVNHASTVSMTLENFLIVFGLLPILGYDLPKSLRPVMHASPVSLTLSTSKVPELSNNSSNIKTNLKTFLGSSFETRWKCWMKKRCQNITWYFPFKYMCLLYMSSAWVRATYCTPTQWSLSWQIEGGGGGMSAWSATSLLPTVLCSGKVVVSRLQICCGNHETTGKAPWRQGNLWRVI